VTANPDGSSPLAPRAGPSRNPRPRSLSKRGDPQCLAFLGLQYSRRMRSSHPISHCPPTQAQGWKPTNQPTCLKLQQLSTNQRNQPIDFYERLCEAFQVYTHFDPEMLENQWMANTVFVTESYADICQKLQKLEGFTIMNASHY
jgi:hypothetical protein